MNKTIFIYFSYSGDNDRLATLLKRETNCDILKLEAENEYTDNNIKIYFQGGKEAVSKKLPTLKPYTFDSNKYDFIIFATPVWAWTFSPVLRTFISENKIQNKKIVALCSHRGSPGKTLEHLIKELPNNQFIFTKEIHAPIKEDGNINKFLEELVLILKHH